MICNHGVAGSSPAAGTKIQSEEVRQHPENPLKHYVLAGFLIRQRPIRFGGIH